MIKWQGSRLYTVNAQKKNNRNGESNIMQQMRGSVV